MRICASAAFRMPWHVAARACVALVMTSSVIAAGCARHRAPNGAPAPAAIKWSDVEELTFNPSEGVKVGQELEIILRFRAYQLNVCQKTQVRVTAPDGTIYDPLAGAEQIGCAVDPPGHQMVRQYFWTTRPGPASRTPWPTLPGKYTVTVEFREFIRDGEIRPGPPIVRTAEFLANGPPR
jgi:hypothetical protein